MQQTPLRLSQTLWSAFRAAKPTRRAIPPPRPFSWVARPSNQPWTCPRPSIAAQARCYSEGKSEIDRKVQEVKSRIDESLDARAETAGQGEQTLKDPRHETIVHTVPEASSIVHTSRAEDKKHSKPQESSASPDRPLPSDSSSRYSHLRNRFTHFMDNFQTHIFTASRRLNDLTGYSGIEELKNEIEDQESIVQASRRAVKEARAKYSDAIATRSQTQREVNDLLHRKHTWSATDLERFTSLYRSDHANEQAEGAAQTEVQEAEARYEEASTKLAKSILARYHEEQIWSDKIRQMSTWGTWGLMGLNVLLFVVFQIMVEPWRRKRLVKGFEERVELALKERDEDRTFTPTVQPNQTAAAAAAMSAGDKVEAVADHIAEQIVDAISGTTADEPPPAPSLSASLPSQSAIEAAAEKVATEEIAAEEIRRGSPETIVPGEESLPSSPTGASSPAPSRWTSPSSALAWYENALRARFSDDQKITLSQRELTTVAMEGVAGGMALMGLIFVLLRPR